GLAGGGHEQAVVGRPGCVRHRPDGGAAHAAELRDGVAGLADGADVVDVDAVAAEDVGRVQPAPLLGDFVDRGLGAEGGDDVPHPARAGRVGDVKHADGLGARVGLVEVVAAHAQRVHGVRATVRGRDLGELHGVVRVGEVDDDDPVLALGAVGPV